MENQYFGQGVEEQCIQLLDGVRRPVILKAAALQALHFLIDEITDGSMRGPRSNSWPARLAASSE